jgi:hypothetical protein
MKLSALFCDSAVFPRCSSSIGGLQSDQNKAAGERKNLMWQYLVAVSIAILLLLLLFQPTRPLHAQAPSTPNLQQSSVRADMRTSIVRAIGVQDQTLEITVTASAGAGRIAGATCASPLSAPRQTEREVL